VADRLDQRGVITGVVPVWPTPQPPRPSGHSLWRRLGWLDYVVLVIVVCFAGFVLYRINTALHYRWNWGAVLSFVAFYDSKVEAWRTNILVQGFWTTLRLVGWASVLALLIGTALGIWRVSKLPLLRMISRFYVDMIRGIPPLVIVFVFYFFISSQIVPLIGLEAFLRSAAPGTLAVIELLAGPRQLVPAFASAALCLALFEAAYIGEIVRAGIVSVEREQWDAARSLGLSRSLTMRLVVLPQAFRRMIPPLASQFISLVKDSSIASLVAVQELAFMAAHVSATTSRIFEVWILAAGVYLIVCLGLSLLCGRIERRLHLRTM
jgi:polar amino acid transport system permease protein